MCTNDLWAQWKGKKLATPQVWRDNLQVVLLF
jgi:hypothetical protein